MEAITTIQPKTAAVATSTTPRRPTTLDDNINTIHLPTSTKFGYNEEESSGFSTNIADDNFSISLSDMNTNADTNTDPTTASTDFDSVNEILRVKFNESTSLIEEYTDTVDNSTYDSYVVPLKIILPVEHVHKIAENGSFARFNYILLKVDDPTYHEHIKNSDKSDLLLPVNENSATPTLIDVDSGGTTETINQIAHVKSDGVAKEMLDPNNSDGANATSKSAAKNNVTLIDADGFRYKLGKHYRISDDDEDNNNTKNNDTLVVEFDDIAMMLPEIPPTITKEPISKRILDDDSAVPKVTQTDDTQRNTASTDQYEGHYAKIFQWLHYHL